MIVVAHITKNIQTVLNRNATAVITLSSDDIKQERHQMQNIALFQV
jgi:hypothetical protein